MADEESAPSLSSARTSLSAECSESVFYKSLSGDRKKDYEDKLRVVNITDPYAMRKSTFDVVPERWPKVTFADIYFYLVNSTSIYTHSQIKAYKSLDAYQFVVTGQTYDVVCREIRLDLYLFLGKVRHSQSMFSKTSNKVWLTVHEDGAVVNAHCTCMAGQGSVCSHVGAILFYIQGVAEFKESQTPSCTSELCSWLPPSLKKVSFAPVKQIQFCAPAKRYTSMTSGHGSHNEAATNAQLKKQQAKDAIPAMSPDELQSFLVDIKSTGVNSAVLSTHPAFCDDSIPFSARMKPPLTSLYDEKFAELPYHLLLSKCDEIFSNISITQDEVDIIEKKTRDQASSNL